MAKPPKGKMTDYKPDETSHVNAPANGRDFLIRMSALPADKRLAEISKMAPDELAAQMGVMTPEDMKVFMGMMSAKERHVLKSQGIDIPAPQESPSFIQSLTQTLTKSVVDGLKFMNQPLSMKGSDTMGDTQTAGQANKSATETVIRMSEDDWAKIDELVDGKISESLKSLNIEALSSRIDAVEQTANKAAETSAGAETQATEAQETTKSLLEVTKSLAEASKAQSDLLTKGLNVRPAPTGDNGGSSAETPVNKSLWAGSGLISSINAAG